MNASVVSELQAAILVPEPATVRAILDRYAHTLRERPSCDKDGWSPLHFLAKAGDDHLNSSYNKLLQVNGNSNTTQIDTEMALQLSTSLSQIDDDDDDDDDGNEFVTPPHPPWVWGRDVAEERYHRARMSIVYMLVDGGMDVNGRDASGLTPLHYAARRGDAALCDALCQCGADLDAQHCGAALYDTVTQAAYAEKNGLILNQCIENHQLTQNNSTEFNLTLNEDTLNSNHPPTHPLPTQGDGWVSDGCTGEGPAGLVYRVFRFYWPGLWRAVATEDICKVRQLVNSWCNVELCKGGLSLRQLAISTANEAVISLLISIIPSMCLVHHCLAGNTSAVKSLLESPARKKINIDIRKLSERGAPLLYFLIRSGNTELIRELRKHGASLYTQMYNDNMVDVPVIFSALESWLSADVVKSLLPAKSSREARLLERVWNRGKNILRQAVENRVNIDAIDAILEVGGAALLSERDPNGLTTLDYAIRNDLTSLVTLFDQHVGLWLTRPDLYPGRRDLLALRGYGRLEEVGLNGVKNNEELVVLARSDVTLFLNEFQRCQCVLAEMFSSIRDGDINTLQQLLNHHSDIFNMADILWQGRIEGDGMPLLHWAVLHGRESIVGMILRSPQHRSSPNHSPVPTVTNRFSVDDLRDGWGRTALHYAAGLPNGKGIEAALLNHGCSEHTLDMDGREPLDFKDARGSPALCILLDNIRNKNFSGPQPDPWDPETLRAHMETQRRQRYQQQRYQHHHHHHAQPQTRPQMSGPPYPYPAHFPTAPGSNFHWPLPRPIAQPVKEEKGGVCCLM